MFHAPPQLAQEALKPMSSAPTLTDRRQYLVYKPFFLQKEFFTDSRRLLSSRAGKLLSSKLSISPWPRAPDLVLPPKDGVVGEIGTHQTTWPFLSSSILSLSPHAPFSRLLASRPRLELEVVWRNSWLFHLRRCIARKETYPPSYQWEGDPQESSLPLGGAGSPESVFLEYFLL